MTQDQQPMMTGYYAAVEGGGTKFNCAIFDRHRQIIAQTRIPTTAPKMTLDAVCEFFLTQREQGYLFSHLGLACFGPLDLDPQSSTYGAVTATPKENWSDYAIASHLSERLDCHVALDTDVNGAALAEYRWGAAQGAPVCIYVTIGTGIGGGVVINGQTLHGLIHPEIGHMLVPAPQGIQGVCPYHGNCVEGLASGTAMAKIWHQAAQTLADDHRAWDIQAEVLAKLCHNLLVTFSPQRILLGGGVMTKPGLLRLVIDKTAATLNGYLVLPKDVSLEQIIVLPGLGQHSGLFGGLALAMDAQVS